jgi:uncharacterized coiled-coil DUF342 family protein
LIENSNEKKLGQIFTEKFPPIESSNQQPSKPRKEIFPWLQEADTRQTSIDPKHIDELIAQKTRQAIDSIRMELAGYKSKLERIASEKNQPNNVDLLRSELAEYKYNLAEYKSKLESILSKKSSQSDIELIQSELANYKSKLDLVASERNQKNDIDSIRTELEEYKTKLEHLASERNHKNDIASIRTELAEYKSKSDLMVNEITTFLEVINSINEEIARLKNNLGAVTLKQDNGFVVYGNKR